MPYKIIILLCMEKSNGFSQVSGNYSRFLDEITVIYYMNIFISCIFLLDFLCVSCKCFQFHVVITHNVFFRFFFSYVVKIDEKNKPTIFSRSSFIKQLFENEIHILNKKHVFKCSCLHCLL